MPDQIHANLLTLRQNVNLISCLLIPDLYKLIK